MKMRITSIMICLVCAGSSFAQEHPFRLGIGGGYPLYGGLQGEYVAPFYNGKFSLSGNFSWLQWNNAQFRKRLNYEELGINYYLHGKGAGFFAHTGYGRFVKGDFEVEFMEEDDPFSGNIETIRKGISNGLNLKAGYQSQTRLYFRIEAGYRIGIARGEVDIYYLFPNGDYQHQEYEEPAVLRHHFIFSAGLGYMF